MNPLRSSLLVASHSPAARRLIESLPPTRAVVERFVGGVAPHDAVAATLALRNVGLLATIDHLGEDVTDDAGADNTVRAYETLIPLLADAPNPDVSVKLTALGLAYDRAGALARAQRIVRCASAHGVTTTIDMESSSLTDVTLDIVRALRTETPSVAAVLQAMLRRTVSDARDLGAAGARVRLCKGAYAEDATVAFQSRDEISVSYRQALDTLWASSGTPLVATHDPVLIHYTQQISLRQPRPFEFQMLYGVRSEEQIALARAGYTVRVYVPYGQEWYGYLMRRLAERPANVAFFLRSLASRN